MFLISKTFWNETEHLPLQAGVPILQTRLSVGFAGGEWETSFKFSLKFTLISEWSVSPVPHDWCSWVAPLAFALRPAQAGEARGWWKKMPGCSTALVKNSFETISNLLQMTNSGPGRFYGQSFLRRAKLCGWAPVKRVVKKKVFLLVFETPVPRAWLKEGMIRGC